jgi:hypothetical protein
MSQDSYRWYIGKDRLMQAYKMELRLPYPQAKCLNKPFIKQNPFRKVIK